MDFSFDDLTRMKIFEKKGTKPHIGESVFFLPGFYLYQHPTISVAYGIADLN